MLRVVFVFVFVFNEWHFYVQKMINICHYVVEAEMVMGHLG